MTGKVVANRTHPFIRINPGLIAQPILGFVPQNYLRVIRVYVCIVCVRTYGGIAMPSWRHMAVITVPAAAGIRVHGGVFSSIAAGYNMSYPNIGLNTIRAHNRTQITHKHILDNDICL